MAVALGGTSMAAAAPLTGAASDPSGAAQARPRAWILVDAATGQVLDAGNDREALPPASLTKLLTALVAAGTLHPDDTLTVSPIAAGEPAMKINMQPGQVWRFQDALYSLLLSSANDAAAALAERVGGSLDGFAAMMQHAGDELQLADDPVLQDPAGLDNSFSVDGGNLLSARDVAIVARAVLAQPLLAQVVATPVYRFTGPDGAQHRLGNHNRLLTTYPGAIGLKTGYTVKSGEDLAAAARRNGRTLIAVVMGAPNLWRNAAALLDEGFARPAGAPGTGDVLPPVPAAINASAPVAQIAGVSPAHAAVLQVTRSGDGSDARLVLVGGLAIPALAVMVRRRQIAVRRRRRNRRRSGYGWQAAADPRLSRR